jgi:hypothetical protein
MKGLARHLLVRYLAMFTDRSQVEDVTKTRGLSEKETEEARRIAAILLRDCG